MQHCSNLECPLVWLDQISQNGCRADVRIWNTLQLYSLLWQTFERILWWHFVGFLRWKSGCSLGLVLFLPAVVPLAGREVVLNVGEHSWENLVQWKGWKNHFSVSRFADRKSEAVYSICHAKDLLRNGRKTLPNLIFLNCSLGRSPAALLGFLDHELL